MSYPSCSGIPQPWRVPAPCTHPPVSEASNTADTTTEKPSSRAEAATSPRAHLPSVGEGRVVPAPLCNRGLAVADDLGEQRPRIVHGMSEIHGDDVSPSPPPPAISASRMRIICRG